MNLEHGVNSTIEQISHLILMGRHKFNFHNVKSYESRFGKLTLAMNLQWMYLLYEAKHRQVA